jgi:hypothetical protein
MRDVDDWPQLRASPPVHLHSELKMELKKLKKCFAVKNEKEKKNVVRHKIDCAAFNACLQRPLHSNSIERARLRCPAEAWSSSIRQIERVSAYGQGGVSCDSHTMNFAHTRG